MEEELGVANKKGKLCKLSIPWIGEQGKKK